MSISTSYLGAGLLHAYAYGPLIPEAGLFAMSCFGDVAFCSDALCVILANSSTIDFTLPYPTPTETPRNGLPHALCLSHCLWRMSDNSPSILQQLVWGSAETKHQRDLCPGLYVLTTVYDFYIYSFPMTGIVRSCIFARHFQSKVVGLHSMHIITAQNDGFYAVLVSGESFLTNLRATFIKVTLSTSSLCEGVLSDDDFSITVLSSLPIPSPVVSSAYDPLSCIAVLLCNSCIVVFNVMTGAIKSSSISEVTKGSCAEMHKISLVTLSANRELRLYAYTFDSVLHVSDITLDLSIPNLYTLTHRISLKIKGGWNPIIKLEKSTTTNEKLKNIVPPYIIHNLCGEAACPELSMWSIEKYYCTDSFTTVIIASEIDDDQCFIADLIVISPFLLGILTINGAILFVDFACFNDTVTISTISTQFLFNHLSNTALATIAGPSSVSPHLVLQLLPIRRAHITPLRLVISSFAPLSVSALCLYRPLTGMTQQRLLRTTAHPLPFSYELQCQVQSFMIATNLFLQQHRESGTPLNLPPQCTPDFISLRITGALDARFCQKAFMFALFNTKLPWIKQQQFLFDTSDGVAHITAENSSNLSLSSLCVFTGHSCDDLSLPFCERCEVVLSRPILNILSQLLIENSDSTDPIISLFTQLGTLYWLCPICLFSMRCL